MKPTILTFLFTAAGITTFLFPTFSKAQQPPTSGGYTQQSVVDEEVKRIAEEAVKMKSKELQSELFLNAIHKAETQVVAGVNYRLCIETHLPSDQPMTDGVVQYIQVVVYKNISGELKITEWKEDEKGCGVNP